MIKLSLECYQTTRHHHILSQPVPFIAHPVAKLILPHIQYVTYIMYPSQCSIFRGVGDLTPLVPLDPPPQVSIGGCPLV